MLYPFLYPFLKRGSPLESVCDSFVVSFFRKRIPKTKIKNVDLTTFYQRMQRNNGAGGSRTHVQTPANIFVYNHRLCISLTIPRHITQA